MSYAAAYSSIQHPSSVNTTDATVTTLFQVPMGSLTAPVNVIETTVTGRRTGGSSGTAGDTAGYRLIATFKNVSGTVSLVGSIITVMASEDQVAWDCTMTVSGQTVIITVAGAANNNVTWTGLTNVTRNI